MIKMPSQKSQPLRTGLGPEPGANPTIVSCSDSAVKFYNSTSSPMLFENKTFSFFFEKNALAYNKVICRLILKS
jgi:hypothetical protein